MSSIAEALASAIGADRVASDADALNARRYDQWAVKHLRDWRGEAVPAPGWVVRPQSVEDVQKVVHLAAEKRIPLIPFGLGSGVCGGIEPTPDAILLDMSAMNRVRYIDSDDLLASFDAGLGGMEAEEAVAAHGLTIGHWPQSIAISSVGGWVATRASGQFSTAYGNIEDIIHSIEAVLPNGELVTLGKAVRAAMHEICASAGLETGDPMAAKQWIEKRNHVPSWRDMFERGYVADTVEISGRWSEIGAIYDDSIAALNQIPGVINASAHSSHVYRSGINLYFSFAATFEDSAKMEPAYFAGWRAIMEATAKHGGGVAHHHGAGRLRKPYLHHDLGESGVALLRRVKQALDPEGIMNPGNLIPDA